MGSLGSTGPRNSTCTMLEQNNKRNLFNTPFCKEKTHKNLKICEKNVESLARDIKNRAEIHMFDDGIIWT